MKGHWDVPLFKGAFFLKGRNYRYPLKKHAEIWALFWENVAKIAMKSKGYSKVV